MTASRTRVRVVAAPLLAGLIALVVASCAPPPAPKPGISFNPPAIGYVGQQYVLKATASNELPVSFSLDAASTGCSLADGTLSYEAVGSCIVLADQPGDETTPALPQVRRTIAVYDCPTLRSGRWTGPQGTSADIVVDGPFFSGTVDLILLRVRRAGRRRHRHLRPGADDLQRHTPQRSTLVRRLEDLRLLQRHLGGAERSARLAAPRPARCRASARRHELRSEPPGPPRRRPRCWNSAAATPNRPRRRRRLTEARTAGGGLQRTPPQPPNRGRGSDSLDPSRTSGSCLPRTPPLPPEWDRETSRSRPQFVGFADPFTGRRNADRPDPERGAPAARSTQAALVTLRAPLWGYRCLRSARRRCTTMSSDHRNRSRRRRSFRAGMLAMSEPGGAERLNARPKRHRATAPDHGPRG